MCRFTLVLFDGVAGASPTCHLEEAWLLFYEEFAFLRHILECLKKKIPLLHALAQCFVSVTAQKGSERLVLKYSR